MGDFNERGLKVIKTKEEEQAEGQSTVMQLRKACSHPSLFDWPIDPNTRYPVLGEGLVNASGKMIVLDRLLRELFKREHKVLLVHEHAGHY